MRISLHFLPALAQCSLAARWAIDTSCASVKLNGGTVIDIRSRLQDAMREALDIATNAMEVIDQHSGDTNVQNIIRIVLGGDPAKVSSARGTFASLTAYEKNPSQFPPHDPQWRQLRRNTDVEIYCSLDRFEQRPSGESRVTYHDTAMGNSGWTQEEFEQYRKIYDLGYDLDKLNDEKRTKARTSSSDHCNRLAYVDARIEARNKGLPLPQQTDPRFARPRPTLACNMDLAPWNLHALHIAQWPPVSREMIEIVMGEEFIAQFTSEGHTGRRTPIDALVNFGALILHELTHTVQGGSLLDIPDKNTCYGWACIQIFQDPKNSDTIAMLGLALQLWKLGYSVDENGYIHTINT